MSNESATKEESSAAAAAAPRKPEAVDFEPPLTCVRRILKNTLPNVNVGKDASAAFARASGIFIIYLTACANDFAREHKRQTITANDILAAVKVGVRGDNDWLVTTYSFYSYRNWISKSSCPK